MSTKKVCQLVDVFEKRLMARRSVGSVSVDDISSAWGEIAGSVVAAQSRVKCFCGKGVITIIVGNSALYANVVYGRNRYLEMFRKRFQGVNISDVVFRFGEVDG